MWWDGTSLTDRATYGAAGVLATVIVAQDVAAADAVRALALLLLARCNVLPQVPHRLAVRCGLALTVRPMRVGWGY